MDTDPTGADLAMRLALALGCGLLIGVERERRKGSGPQRRFAGVRTFALTALLGGLVQALGAPMLTAIAALFVAGMGALAWARNAAQDPGATTEVALFLTFVLGAWAVHTPALAAAVAVAVAGVLAARGALQRFSTEVLSEQEYRSVLVLAAAALIVLPVLPREPIAALAGLHLHAIWRLVVTIMVIQTLGHVALRIVGPRWGNGLAGFASGFVSSTATIAELGGRARAGTAPLRSCVSGAVMSGVATYLQLVAIAAVVDPGLVVRLLPVLALPALVTAALGAWWAWQASRDAAMDERRAMHSLRAAAALALALSACTAAATWVEGVLGARGLAWAAALAGLADAHAPAAALFARAAAEPQRWAEWITLIVLVLSTNTAAKCTLAAISGGARYGAATTAGLAPGVVLAWLALAATKQ